MNDYSPPERDLGLPSPPFSSPPPAEDAQVTDVFYEDAFNDPGLETVTIVVAPGQI